MKTKKPLSGEDVDRIFAGMNNSQDDVSFSEPAVLLPTSAGHDGTREGNKFSEDCRNSLGNVEDSLEQVNHDPVHVGRGESDASLNLPSNPNAGVIPSWYMFFKRAKVKKAIIKHLLDEYAKPASYGGVTYQPEYKEVQKYQYKLKSRTLKELLLMGSLKKYDLKLDPLDRLKSINKKKHAVVTIFNNNKTTDTGVIHCYDRTFSRGGMTYIIMSDRGIYDPEFKMSHFYFYANNPFPIIFAKTKIPEASADAKLLDDTIEMKVIEALANIQMAKVINLLLIIGILNFIMLLVTMLVCLRGFKIV